MLKERLRKYRMKIDLKLLSLGNFSPDTSWGNILMRLILTAQSAQKSKDDNVVFSVENPLEQY